MRQNITDFYSSLRDRFKEIVDKNNLGGETVTITGKVLSVKEAIGDPLRKDFPLLTGKERLMEADFRGSRGQAYTDMPGNFSGTLSDILDPLPKTNFERGVYISTLNAVCRYMGLLERSVHCKNEEPEECGKELVRLLSEEHTYKRIALVGFQPSMLENLANQFEVRNLDLDRDRIGETKFGVLIEDGIGKRDEVLAWCDLILATGSTLVNGTITDYLGSKPVWFYGTTILGAARLMGLKNYCMTPY